MGLIVYILRCNDGTYYTGVTSNIENRIQKHALAFYKDSYTSTRLPVRLLWWNYFQSNLEAIGWEKRIKKWSKLKKEALIRGDYDALQVLSECRNESHYKYWDGIKGKDLG